MVIPSRNNFKAMPTIKKFSIATFGALCVTLATGEVARAIITAGDSNDPMYIAAPGMFSGVGLINSDGICTGTLLPGGYDILTAAHCVTDSNGTFLYDLVSNTTVTFNPDTGPVTFNVKNFFVDPNYDGNFIKGNDIAVIQLANQAPANVERYDIYRSSNEVGQIFTKVEYGVSGTGNEGDYFGDFDGKLRYGQNRYDSLNDLFKTAGVSFYQDTIPGSQLMYDFDDGTAAHDAFGLHFGPSFADTGLGKAEVNTAEGDSGGPGFIGNLIASITSSGFSDSAIPDGKVADVGNGNSAFGEFSNDTRVSFYQKFIADAMAGRLIPNNLVSVPEPSSILGILTFGILGRIFLRFSKK